MEDDAAGAERSPFESLRVHHLAPISGVSDTIAPDDAMYGGNDEHYRSVGQSAWRCITAALLAAGVDEPRRVLDMSCGHGRVMRVLARGFPRAALTACDLDRSAVEFCAREFGAVPVQSRTDLSRVAFDEPFDLVWCGSLLTHLDVPAWLEAFRLFRRCLRPGGVLVATFHGRWVADRMRQGVDYGLPRERVEAVLESYQTIGFGYADYVGQDGYGVSVSAPAWVLRELAGWYELRVVGLAEQQWDDHQDVLALQRRG